MAGAALLVLGLVAWRAPGTVQKALWSMQRTESMLKELPADPRLGTFSITYRYPAYAERPVRREKSPRGVDSRLVQRNIMRASDDRTRSRGSRS